MDHIGMDVHKKESQLCILTEDGELIERRVGTDPEHFAAVGPPSTGSPGFANNSVVYKATESP